MPSDFDSLDAELAEIDGKAGAPAKGSSRLLPAIVAVIALLSFGVIVVYAYNQGVQEGSEDAAPVLRSKGPSKVPPQSPGGLMCRTRISWSITKSASNRWARRLSGCCRRQKYHFRSRL